MLDHLADAPPDGLDEVVRLIHRAANAKKNGKPRKRERVSADKVRAWLLGEAALTEDERVLLDAARRSARLRARFAVLLHELRNPEVHWRAPS